MTAVRTRFAVASPTKFPSSSSFENRFELLFFDSYSIGATTENAPCYRHRDGPTVVLSPFSPQVMATCSSSRPNVIRAKGRKPWMLSRKGGV
eukprot:5540783-Heterocapsa_arctica.AAC.1